MQLHEADWYVRKGEIEEGPFTRELILRFAAHQIIAPDTSLRSGVDGPWVPAAEYTELFAADSGPAVPDKARSEASQGESQSARDEARFARGMAALTPHIGVTLVLMAINLVVFVLTLQSGAGLARAGSNEVLIAWGGNLGALTKDGGWWRLGASMFLHSGLAHLLFNLLALWYGGRFTERLYGNALYLLIYIGAGLAGALTSLLWHDDAVMSVGASGAVFGVYGALLAFILRRGSEVPAAPLIRIASSALLLIGYSLFNGFTSSGVDNPAHVGGLVSGFLIGLACARPFDLAQRWHSWLHWPLGLGVTASILLTLFVLTPPPTFSYAAEQAAERAIKKFAEADQQLMGRAESVQKQLARLDRLRAAQLIRTELLAPFQAVESELAIVTLEPAAPAAKLLDLLQRYARERRQLFDTLVAIVESGDGSRETELTRRTAELKKTREELNTLNEELKKKTRH